MLGLLAALITLLLGIAEKEIYRKYKRGGYAEIFFFIYYTSIIFLLFTAFFSMINYSPKVLILPYQIMFIFFVASIILVSLITIIITNLLSKSD